MATSKVKNEASKAKSAAPSRGAPSEARTRLGSWAFRGAAALVVVSALGAILYGQRRRLVGSAPYAELVARVRLADTPDWMPDEIARGIVSDVQAAAMRSGGARTAVDGARTVFDQALTRDVYRGAAENPWIAQVDRVSRHEDGAVVVHASYRRPFALVRSAQLPPDQLTVVAGDAVVLPLGPRLYKTSAYIIIGEVAGRPPGPGQPWDAPDLAAGLRLLQLIAAKPYAAEVTTVDVRNHAGRISKTEPHLRLYAQMGRGRRTDIRFGRFPAGDDYCISPQRKLAYLDEYYKTNGNRLAGRNEYVDLRYDKLHVSVH